MRAWPLNAQPTDNAVSLRAAGLKSTPQRRAILQVLEASERPLSVEEIRVQLGGGSGIPTIYRNLQCFVDQGWAESLVGTDLVMRFVRCHSKGHHHHIQCEGCGRSAEVQTCAVEASLATLGRPAGFHLTRHQLALFGLCPECQKLT